MPIESRAQPGQGGGDPRHRLLGGLLAEVDEAAAVGEGLQLVARQVGESGRDRDRRAPPRPRRRCAPASARSSAGSRRAPTAACPSRRPTRPPLCGAASPTSLTATTTPAPISAATLDRHRVEHAAVDDEVLADPERRIDARDREAGDHRLPEQAGPEDHLLLREDVGGHERERRRQVLDPDVPDLVVEEPADRTDSRAVPSWGSRSGRGAGRCGRARRSRRRCPCRPRTASRPSRRRSCRRCSRLGARASRRPAGRPSARTRARCRRRARRRR